MNLFKRNLLIQALINRPNDQIQRLIELENHALMLTQKDDWLWHLLLSSMSTMGNSRGYAGLIENMDNYALVSYNNLLPLDQATRLNNIQLGLSNANVRRYKLKTKWLLKNYEFIQDCGGVETIQNFILQSVGRDCKIQLLKLFEGIGDKYARNIFMDMCHEDFINSVAIDERLIDISDSLEIARNQISYLEHENLFIEIANDAGLNPWQMDRLLYNYTQYYLNSMNQN